MKKGSKILGIILIIIVTFSLGTVGGYYLFKMKMDNSNNSSVEGDKKNNPDEKDNVNSKEEVNDNTSKDEVLSLTDSIVKELFSRKTNFHISSKVTYDTLSDQKKLGVDLDGLKKRSFNLGYKDICDKLKNSGNPYMIDGYDTCISLKNKWEDDTDLVTYYTIDDVKKNNIKYFNESSNLPKDYSYVMLTTLELSPGCEKVVLQSKDNYYLDMNMHCGYGGLEPVIENNLVKAVKSNDEIILYDTYVIGIMDDNIGETQYFNFYGDEDFINKIKSLEVIVTDDGFLYDKNELAKFKQTYKHTYKKNKSGEYYWVSSEPVSSVD